MTLTDLLIMLVALPTLFYGCWQYQQDTERIIAAMRSTIQ